ncbi:MAG: hypothetical protein HYZ27_03010 [Deltaproteobacteria bacterium]|nr:hypothetical protein [Deltaproteobacteria bacterium]
MPLVIKPHAASGLLPSRVDAQVRAFDLMPTLLDLAGLPFPREQLAAQSLVDLMRGDPPPARRPAFSENVKHHVLSLRDAGFMYYLRHAPASPSAEQLFNLRADPRQSRNVADKQPQVVNTMRRQVVDFLLRERHGLVLVVLGDGDLHDYAVRLSPDAASAPVSLIGAPLVRRARQREFRGHVAGPVVLLARLGGAATPAPTVTVSVDGEERVSEQPLAPVRHSPDLLDDAVASDEVRAYLVRTTRELPGVAERQTTSGERLEALRALGYVR